MAKKVFVDGNKFQGIQGTKVTAADMNGIQNPRFSSRDEDWNIDAGWEDPRAYGDGERTGTNIALACAAAAVNGGKVRLAGGPYTLDEAGLDFLGVPIDVSPGSLMIIGTGVVVSGLKLYRNYNYQAIQCLVADTPLVDSENINAILFGGDDAISKAVASASVGARVTVTKDTTQNRLVVGKGGVVVDIVKGVTVYVSYAGPLFQMVAGFSVLGRGKIKYTVKNTDCAILFKPIEGVAYSSNTTNRTVFGDLIMEGYDLADKSGIGFMFDTSDESGSWIHIGNPTFRFFDKCIDFNVPDGTYISSVFFGDVVDVYCRAFMDEYNNSGQIAAFTFKSIHVQPDQGREYGLKTDNFRYLSIQESLFWDWETKTNPSLIKEKILLGQNTYACLITSPTSQGNNFSDFGIFNRIITAGFINTTSPATPAVIPPPSHRDSYFSGQQDNFLVGADVYYTVTNSEVAMGSNISQCFSTKLDEYCAFDAGTDLNITIDLDLATYVSNVGISFWYGYLPSSLKIEVYSAREWRVLLDVQKARTYYHAQTKMLRLSVEQIRFTFSSATEVRVHKIYGFSPLIKGSAFIAVDGGRNYILRDLVFDTGAIGMGLSVVDELSGRYRIFSSGGHIKGIGAALLRPVNKSTSSTVARDKDLVRYIGSGGHTETLPAATGTGRVIEFKHRGTGSWVISSLGGDLIDGNTTITLTANQWASLTDSAIGEWDLKRG